MSAGIRKRHEARARYDVALASWQALDTVCPACHRGGIIRHEEGELPCPYCRPYEAREAAQIYDPVEVKP